MGKGHKKYPKEKCISRSAYPPCLRPQRPQIHLIFLKFIEHESSIYELNKYQDFRRTFTTSIRARAKRVHVTLPFLHTTKMAEIQHLRATYNDIHKLIQGSAAKIAEFKPDLFIAIGAFFSISSMHQY
jgi:hypothetical protein